MQAALCLLRRLPLQDGWARTPALTWRLLYRRGIADTAAAPRLVNGLAAVRVDPPVPTTPVRAGDESGARRARPDDADAPAATVGLGAGSRCRPTPCSHGTTLTGAPSWPWRSSGRRCRPSHGSRGTSRTCSRPRRSLALWTTRPVRPPGPRRRRADQGGASLRRLRSRLTAPRSHAGRVVVPGQGSARRLGRPCVTRRMATRSQCPADGETARSGSCVRPQRPR